MTALFDLGGKVCVVAGSSRGIGKVSAEALAAHGAWRIGAVQILPRRGRGTSRRLVEGYFPRAVSLGAGYPSTAASPRSPSPSGGGMG